MEETEEVTWYICEGAGSFGPGTLFLAVDRVLGSFGHSGGVVIKRSEAAENGDRRSHRSLDILFPGRTTSLFIPAKLKGAEEKGKADLQIIPHSFQQPGPSTTTSRRCLARSLIIAECYAIVLPSPPCLRRPPSSPLPRTTPQRLCPTSQTHPPPSIASLRALCLPPSAALHRRAPLPPMG